MISLLQLVGSTAAIIGAAAFVATGAWQVAAGGVAAFVVAELIDRLPRRRSTGAG